MITRKGSLRLAAVVLGVFVTREARGAGTALDVQSARGTGMAAATTAMIDDSAAVFYNPAGIARGRTIDAQVGDTLIAPSFKFTDTQGKKTKLPFYVIPPFNGYASGGITDNLSVGIGAFTPYGLVIKWPVNWEGRSIITRAKLATYEANPTVAYRFGPVRLGLGLQIVRSTVELDRDVSFGDTVGTSALGAGTWGAGVNGGVQADLIGPFLTVGAHYRSAVKLSFDGQAAFNGVPSELAGVLHDQPARTSLILPDTLAFGVSSRPIKPLVLDVDAVWLGWGRFKSINLAFPQDASGTLGSSTPKRWNNTVNVHAGAELALAKHWSVRGGVMFDPSPSPSGTLTPDIPDADRVNLAAGGTYHHESGIRVELGYQLLVLISKTSTAPQLPGEYGGFANILGVTVGYSRPLPSRSR